MNEIYKMISVLGNKYKASKIVLFGSRARGDNRERSDIDIAVYKMPKENQSIFLQEIEDLPTLVNFDVVFITEKTSSELLENIERDGVVLMNKFNEKFEKFKEAVNRLDEAVSDYKAIGNSTVRDGVIKRFEFCTELAWKAMREYLIEEGYSEINSPKAVMKQAYADGIIKNGELWIELINARNITSHVYDEEASIEIFNDIYSKYLPSFNELIKTLNN